MYDFAFEKEGSKRKVINSIILHFMYELDLFIVDSRVYNYIHVIQVRLLWSLKWQNQNFCSVHNCTLVKMHPVSWWCGASELFNKIQSYMVNVHVH